MKRNSMLFVNRYWLTVAMLPFLLLTCRGDEKRTTFDLEFLKSNYTSVSFENLKENPAKYSGAQISISGVLQIDNNWLVEDLRGSIAALYNKSFAGNNGADQGIMKIGLDPIYADALHKFGFGQQCTLYGVYTHALNNAGSDGLFCFIRIDRVESPDGKCINFQYRMEQKRKGKK